MNQEYFGVDVSKTKLNIGWFMTSSKIKVKVFANDKVGVSSLFNWMNTQLEKSHVPTRL